METDIGACFMIKEKLLLTTQVLVEVALCSVHSNSSGLARVLQETGDTYKYNLGEFNEGVFIEM